MVRTELVIYNFPEKKMNCPIAPVRFDKTLERAGNNLSTDKETGKQTSFSNN